MTQNSTKNPVVQVSGRGTNVEFIIDDVSPFDQITKGIRDYLVENRGMWSGGAIAVNGTIPGPFFAMAACAMAASIHPLMKPPCTTPPEWHCSRFASYSRVARPSGSVSTMRTSPNALRRLSVLVNEKYNFSGCPRLFFFTTHTSFRIAMRMNGALGLILRLTRPWA